MKQQEAVAGQELPCVGSAPLFFSEREREVRRAVALCRGCPVRRSCARDAIAREERYGVWGGLSEADLRRAVLAARRATREVSRDLEIMGLGRAVHQDDARRGWTGP